MSNYLLHFDDCLVSRAAVTGRSASLSPAISMSFLRHFLFLFEITVSNTRYIDLWWRLIKLTIWFLFRSPVRSASFSTFVNVEKDALRAVERNIDIKRRESPFKVNMFSSNHIQ